MAEADSPSLRHRLDNTASQNGGLKTNHFTERRDALRLEELRRKTEKLRGEVLEQIDGQLTDLFDGVLRDIESPDEGSTSDRFTDKNNGHKVFKPRNSMLTELLEVCHVRTIYNIFVALLIVFVLNTVIYDFIDTGRLSLDFSIMIWTFGKTSTVINIWLVMNIMAFLVFPVFRFFASSRSAWYRLPDMVWLLSYIGFIVVFVVFPIQEVCSHDLPPASSIIILTEQVRLILKVHAFVRSNTPKVLAMSTTPVSSKASAPVTKEGEEEDEESADSLPEFGQYLYFLFCPTLVYRDHYPMTPYIRWDYVVSNFVQVFLCILYTYYVFVRFCVPVFRNTGKEPGNFKNLILSAFSCMLPGTMVLVLGFFAILHSWLNAFAEMTRFADRMFYKDWWNSPSYANWYRTWNVVVHDWLYTYIYKDLVELTNNRKLATVTVFVVSALAHEYVLVVAFRFFFPILFTMFGGIGLSFVFLKPNTRGQVSQSWNVFMWITLFLGNGLLMCLYSQEWFATKNCPRTNENFLELLIPRSWSSECMGKT